jgi:hypothetical protein
MKGEVRNHDITTRPNINDVRQRLPHTEQLARMYRALAHVFYLFVHYTADRWRPRPQSRRRYST